MVNRWYVDDDPILRWKAYIGPLFQAPDQAVAWLRQLLEAAEAEKVCTVYATDTYQRTKDGPFPAFVQAEYERTGVVDLDVFRWRRTDQIGGQLAYYDPQGQVQETEVFDLGVFWQQCHADTSDTTSWWYHRPVLRFLGPTLATRDPAEMTRIKQGVHPDAGVVLALYSDIWLPWIDGLVDETHEVGKVYDNRALARQHTPRLNRFLAAVHAATQALGCAWSLDREPDALAPNWAFMVHDTGIDLEATLPEGVKENDGMGLSPFQKMQSDAHTFMGALRQAREDPTAPRTPIALYRWPTAKKQQMLAERGIPWHMHEED
ncbi:MAG: hypothetical protein AAGF95_24250 [Chloroflexota bacterium]